MEHQKCSLLDGQLVERTLEPLSFRDVVGAGLRRRHEAVSADVQAIAWKAQHRLSARYRHLVARGKCPPEAVTAVARELLGFIWAIGTHVEATTRTAPAAAA